MNRAATIIPAASVLAALVGAAMAARSLARGQRDDLAAVSLSGILSIVAIMMIHIAFSYQRHLEYGWMMDAYPRYYLPLIAIVPLAGLYFAENLPARMMRKTAFGFLLTSPFIYAFVG